MNIKEILQNTHLSPLNTEILLSLAINKPKEYLFAHPEYKLNKKQVARYKLCVTRRLRGEPIAYIAGKKEFYGLEFFVNKNVLIPRPETELLVEKVLDLVLKVQPFSSRLSREARFPKVEPLAIIDIGTGSGNIIISIVKNIPKKTRKKINFYALDISKKVLFTAKKNSRKHKVTGSIKFVQSDLLDYFLKKRKFKLGNLLIVANLPYVSPQIYQKNKKSLKYEPKTALISNKGGSRHYERLIKQVKNLLFVAPCSLIIEISPEQKNVLAKIVKRELTSAKIKFFKDLSGKARVVKIETKFRTKLTKTYKS